MGAHRRGPFVTEEEERMQLVTAGRSGIAAPGAPASVHVTAPATAPYVELTNDEPPPPPPVAPFKSHKLPPPPPHNPAPPPPGAFWS